MRRVIVRPRPGEPDPPGTMRAGDKVVDIAAYERFLRVIMGEYDRLPRHVRDKAKATNRW